MDEVGFTSLSGEQIYFSRSLGILPRVGERVAFPSKNDWYKVTAVYHEIGDIRRQLNKHIVIVEKM